ncbi:hypothetical protein KZ523_002721 [Enterococcus faecalis]|uniref:hypothetical protein n=1 Tax=Enterococcus faecalis TaxID=1351 RepID=UPI0019F64AA5|nr:hypothetical protein [Enterococcus faecalis]EGO5859922.1 hypothetical protein [Enterococcus faecalis]EHU9646931.1 hypothetical protein [Enterococcus faecalis]EHU9665812.1 hypothetical protein [Enterococcus faecalis]EIA7730379.1 hypothetical protein [Enterococcus faecalis]EKN1389201.1 hypothetical protein [Enterococcus faecalis]
MKKQNNNSKKDSKEKAKWTLLLFIATFLFVISLLTGMTYLSLFSIGIALYIYKSKGDKIIFEEYNKKQEAKLKEAKVVQDAMKEIVSEKMFRKNKGE